MYTIDFFSLSRLHRDLEPNLLAACKRVIASGHFVLGEEVEAFEREFAQYCGSRHAISVGNGFDALELTLQGLSIGVGDEVLVPAQTFVATWLAVSRVGAVPVGVDVDAQTGNMDPAAIPAKLTARTRAILPVHLFGQMAEMETIHAIARDKGLIVIEDAAQAHGASFHGRPVGAGSAAATFSFYPAKNLGALGDGGMIITNDDTLYDKLLQLRNYGSKVRYIHEISGQNSRLDEIQAACLRVKLPFLEGWNCRRQQIASTYTEMLSPLAGVLDLPAVPAETVPVWHQYVVRTKSRDELMKRLSERGIGTAIHYPIIPSNQSIYLRDTAASKFPVAEDWAKRSLSLPIGPYLSDAEVQYIGTSIREILS